MRWRPRRPPRAPFEVASGERLLAWSDGEEESAVGGTRDALYLYSPLVQPALRRIPWEQVEAASWDLDTELLEVSEVGRWGEERVEHSLSIIDPTRLLQLVRERVTASIVLQRHVPITERRGVRVIARRAPGRAGDVSWVYEYDEGVDPDDPFVRVAAAQALESARDEVGGL